MLSNEDLKLGLEILPHMVHKSHIEKSQMDYEHCTHLVDASVLFDVIACLFSLQFQHVFPQRPAVGVQAFIRFSII